MKAIRLLIGVLALGLVMVLSGCASGLGGGGMSVLDVKPILNAAGDPVASEVHATLGKEYGRFSLELNRDSNGAIDLKVQADEVAAFEGQAIDAEALARVNAEIARAIEAAGPSIIRALLVP